MTDITLIFPDQLFLKHPGIQSGRPIYLVEEFLFYKIQPFHKQRLILLRAAMRKYADKLSHDHHTVIYIPAKDLSHRGHLFERLGKKPIKNIHVAEFADEWLSQDLTSGAHKYGWTIHVYPSPGFMCSNEDLKTFFTEKEHYSMAQFYSYQRKSRGLLMKGKSPVGGQYSFDPENRKKLPKDLAIPSPFIPSKDKQTDIVRTEIEHEFPDAIGETSSCLYP